MKKVICISGKARHGKDTVAEIVRNLLIERGQRVGIVHYADLLKYFCKTYFGWDGNKDEKGRSILQHVGTDVVRKKEPDYWVDFLINFLHLFEDEWDYVLVPDCRFPNEVDGFVNEFLFSHWRVQRPNFDNQLTEEQKQHPSETALDKHWLDELIINDGTIEELTNKLSSLVDEMLEND